jgi:acyl-CoA thioesterase-1
MKRLTTYGLVLAFCQVMLLAMAPAAHAREKLVLAIGDSLTSGYGLKPNESFPAQLEAALRKNGMDVRVHNAGVSGDTTTVGRNRLSWVLARVKAKPDLAIIELGANDMLRGQPPKQAKANLDFIISSLKGRGIPVLLTGMKASYNLDKAYRAEFDAIYPALAKKHRVPLYPFYMDGVTGNREMLLPDQLHPTAKGVAEIVRRITPQVRAALR